EVAGRERLDRDILDLPRPAEACGGKREVRFLVERRRKVTAKQAEAAFVGFGRRGEVVSGERCRADPACGRPAGMDALGPRAVLEELQVAARERERDALRAGELGGRELHQAPGGQAAGERA